MKRVFLSVFIVFTVVCDRSAVSLTPDEVKKIFRMPDPVKTFHKVDSLGRMGNFIFVKYANRKMDLYDKDLNYVKSILDVQDVQDFFTRFNSFFKVVHYDSSVTIYDSNFDKKIIEISNVKSIEYLSKSLNLILVEYNDGKADIYSKHFKTLLSIHDLKSIKIVSPVEQKRQDLIEVRYSNNFVTIYDVKDLILGDKKYKASFGDVSDIKYNYPIEGYFTVADLNHQYKIYNLEVLN